MLQDENLLHPSSFINRDIAELMFYYNDAARKMNDLKNKFNKQTIIVKSQDGKEQAYAVSDKPHKETLNKIERFNTLEDYFYNMNKLKEIKTKTGTGFLL